MRTEFAAVLLLACAPPASALAQTLPPAGDRVTAAVAEAVQRFGLPESWIRVVMRRESGGDPRATSPKGAMGLMQLMPATWATLRAELGLGADPYDVRDNVIAGAAYLRQLYDQFGASGFLAAYNAGPRRYLDYVERGRPLPDETRAYVAAITRTLDGNLAPASIHPLVLDAAAPPSVFVQLGAPLAPPGSSALFIQVAGK